MKKSAFYHPRRVHHQFAEEFSIPAPPPTNMESKAPSRALAQITSAKAYARWSWYTLREVAYEEYLGWFGQVGKLHLFREEFQEQQ